MAINRALMNRQMYNMGGSSLETGAPDITLTGDMRPTYSAMRKQRLAGGGIAGLQNRQGYFLGKLVDKIRDDIIPNEIKENPVITALGGAALLNQFGLPDFITKAPVIGDYLSDDFGKNFLGNLINKDLVIGPGGEQLSNIANIDKIDDYLTTGGYFGESGGSIVDEFGEAGRTGMESSPTISITDVLKNVGLPSGGVTGAISNALGIPEIMNQLPASVQQAIRQQTGINTTGPNTTNMTDAQKNQLAIEQYKRRNLQADLAKALAAGSAAGAYVESQPKDELPTDTTGLDIPAITTAARGTDAQAEAAGLRFLPPQVARAADGGRIGYDMGGGVMMASNIENDKILEALLEKYLDMGLSLPKAEEAAQEEFDRMSMRPSNRVMAQEGGLMDLGGMEKDYREEGGFVPIGGKEKADDVPARLSKNEFVFTADAVRNAGGGDIDEGAAIMERMMKNLEQGGEVSEESQGLEGAREMFETSQRLEKRII